MLFKGFGINREVTLPAVKGNRKLETKIKRDVKSFMTQLSLDKTVTINGTQMTEKTEMIDAKKIETKRIAGMKDQTETID